MHHVFFTPNSLIALANHQPWPSLLQDIAAHGPHDSGETLSFFQAAYYSDVRCFHAVVLFFFFIPIYFSFWGGGAVAATVK